MNDLTNKADKAQTIFNYLKTSKRAAGTLPWLSPEEAWILPALDCKGFSALMLELLKGLGIKSEMWIGLNNPEGDSHAWVEVNVDGKKVVFDRNYCQPIPIDNYLHAHPYTLRTKVAKEY